MAQRRRWWPSIASALGRCIVLSGVFWRRFEKRHPHNNAAVRKTQCNHPKLFQCRTSFLDCGSTLKQHWVNSTCLRKVYSRPSDGLMLGQRRRPLNQQWTVTLAQHTFNRNLVGGLHRLYEVHRSQVLNEYWPAPAMVVEGIHVEDIF